MTSATPSARLHAFLLPRPEIVQFLPRSFGAARSPLVRVVTSAGRRLDQRPAAIDTLATTIAQEQPACL